MNFLDLPTVMLIEIFEYLTYEEVSKKRLVSRRIDQICQQVLNGGFNKCVRQHSISFKRIKALLPRRESERRNHCLARHADILTSIETRISMLSMTYTKYMDLNLCCFIPGRVLDEIFRILRLIAIASKPLRPHEVLQELRDISSMAIEHFDEKIAYTLKKSFVDNSSSGSAKTCTDSSSRVATNSNITVLGLGGNAASTSATSTLSPHCCDGFRHRLNTLLSLGQTGLLDAIKKPAVPSLIEAVDIEAIDAIGCESSNTHKIVGGCAEARATMMYFKKLEMEYKKGIVKMHRMQQIQTHQTRRLQQTLTSVAELNMQIVELKKRLEDVDAKNREISANIKQINTGEPANGAATAETATVTVPPALLLVKTCVGGGNSEISVTATKRPYDDDIITPATSSSATAQSTSCLLGTSAKIAKLE